MRQCPGASLNKNALQAGGFFDEPVEDELGVESIAHTLRAQASQLAAMAALIDASPAIPAYGVPMAVQPSVFEKTIPADIDIGQLAQAHYERRRARDAIFNDPELFGEPAWDILLDLARAQSAGQHVSVKSACVGSCSPATTGLRWLGILEKRGLVERQEDPFDKRRAYVRLSKDGAAKLRKYFGANG